MIDWSRVEESRDEIGDEDLVEIVELFLAEITDAVQALETIGSGQPLSDALHGIKGSAMNLGFNAVATLCAEGEASAADFDRIQLRSAVLSSQDAVTDRYKSLF